MRMCVHWSDVIVTIVSICVVRQAFTRVGFNSGIWDRAEQDRTRTEIVSDIDSDRDNDEGTGRRT